MIKKDIVKRLSDNPICFRISQKHIGKIVTEVFNIITEALLSNEDVQLRGFGHFVLRYRPPRVINHPSTGKQIMSHPKYVILFEPARNVKRELRLAEPKVINEKVEHD
jgi:integration host factor subunit beta